MSPAPINTPCPLCFTNGLLKGGELFAAGEHWYVYLFKNADGSIRRGMLNPQEHYADLSLMPTGSCEEYFKFRGFIHRDLFPIQDYNVYSNEGGKKSESRGYLAGMRIKGHFHEHLIPRLGHTPASGMGTGMLISRFNDLVWSLEELARNTGPTLAAQLSELIANAKKL